MKLPAPRARLRLLATLALAAPAAGIGLTPAAVARAAPGDGPVNVTINIPADVRPNPCSPGDFVALSGQLHILMFTRADGAGSYHVTQHTNFHGTGQSLMTGVRYVGNDVGSSSLHAAAPLPVTETATYSLGLHGAGPTDDFVVHETVHTTVNAHGVPTAEVANGDMRCSG